MRNVRSVSSPSVTFGATSPLRGRIEYELRLAIRPS